jgi:hypothetical protein
MPDYHPHPDRRKPSRIPGDLPLFSGATPVPPIYPAPAPAAAPAPLAAPAAAAPLAAPNVGARLSEVERRIFIHVSDRSGSAPFYCDDSSATIAMKLGIDQGTVRKVRRQLVRLGVLILEQPSGFPPRVAPAKWPTLPNDPDAHRMPLADHQRRAEQVLAVVMREVGQLSRLHGELGDDSSATRLAGVAELLAAAVAQLQVAPSVSPAIGAPAEGDDA